MLTEIMLTCLRSLLIFLRCTSLVTLSLLQRLSRLLLLLFSRLLCWRLNSWLLICISISVCFNNCWHMINHSDQMIWCCRCVHCLSAAMIHMCRAFIEHACKCKHCFVRKHDYMMNSALHHFQLLMHCAAQAMNHHLNACIKTHLTLRLWQWESEWLFSQLCEIVSNSWVETLTFLVLITSYYCHVTSSLSRKCWLKQAVHDEIRWWINSFLLHFNVLARDCWSFLFFALS